jgi:formylmethanofuran dehydrogenase subunit E-like metal-binding protein
MFRQKSIGLTTALLLWTTLFLLMAGLFLPNLSQACSSGSEYRLWQAVGSQSALNALWTMKKQKIRFKDHEFIALTNAGYAEIDGRSTQAAEDGLCRILHVGRGDHSLIEIHSSSEAALWFAVYHKPSGTCVYLQVNPSAISGTACFRNVWTADLFAINAIETINAEHLYANAAEYAAKFDAKVFGGNEFRIVTIANAVAAGAPAYAVRAFEFHDHYCPGVTSGILMAQYLKQFFPLAPGGSYFVQTVQPWCKEDALMVILNTTPGKKSYAVTYPTAEDMATWAQWAKDAATIVYRRDPQSGLWDGLVLGYQGGDTGCPDYGHSVINKLCADLWYLAHMDHPEDFIVEIHAFDLPAGVDPKAYARPGVDPMALLGLTK